MIPKGTSTNDPKAGRAAVALREMLADASQRGFYGTVAIEVAVQDGVVQCIRRRVERLER